MNKYFCNHCGKEYEVDISLGNWFKGNMQKLGYGGYSSKKFCSYECGKQHMLEKCKQTNIKKYGVDNPAKSKEIKEKSKNTINKNIKENPDYYENKNKKRRESNLKKYGVIHTMQLKSVQEKCKQTCMQKYGSISPMGNIKIQEKSKETCLKKYGTEWGIQNENIKQQRKETCLEKYGVEYVLQINKVRQKEFETKKLNGSLKSSKGEQELKEFIENLGFKIEKLLEGNDKNTRFEIDIYIPEKKIGIEYNGSYWHSSLRKSSNYHYNKSKLAESKGIKLIHIWEDQWKNKNELVKTILKARLGVLNNSEKIYARQCIIKEINNKEYQEFCNNNHIMGYKKASIKLGLFYKDKLIQIASFSKTHNIGRAKSQNNKYEYEWVRGCPASNNVVIGGTSKLFKYFIKKYNPKSVLCYADWNLFDGKGYKECGFKLEGYTGPDKFYIKNNTMERINRNPYKYKEFKELVQQNKLFMCFGAGSLKFIYYSNNL